MYIILTTSRNKGKKLEIQAFFIIFQLSGAQSVIAMKLSIIGNPCTTSFMAKASKPGNMPQHTDFEVTHTFYYIQFLDGFMLMDYNQIGMKCTFKK